MSEHKTDGTSGTYVPVPCAFYDHLELACVNASEIELTTDEGSVSGIARTLRIKDSTEVLVLESGNGETREVRLDRIRAWRVDPSLSDGKQGSVG